MKVAVVTISDRSYRKERKDLSGPAIIEIIKKELESGEIGYRVIPDEKSYIIRSLRYYCNLGYDLIITTGGTGVTTRDVTPEATLEVINRRLPGFEEIMRIKGFDKTPNAIISRGVTGICGKTLIVNLPGSPQGATENLQVILPAIPHTVEKIHDEPSEP